MTKIFPILIADDDLGDCQLVQKALQQNKVLNPLFVVHDGIELLDFLNQRGEYSDAEKFPPPGLLLLDLNMPKKDGREALSEIKSNPKLRSIPVVIMTNSRQETDIAISYELGVNSYIEKPLTFESLVDLVKALNVYWFEIVTLPNHE
ncbi:MAG: Response regulator rcp1 [Chlamydiales bacterium]|nr:Response regulator rcp1 [Chlamydiales bacterium]MCH9619827.1 Response regulator rcp1 [Chlamydiales bacterium]MCH9622746.1 Response regulator rcp1 [Chlamydiales bacterium]